MKWRRCGKGVGRGKVMGRELEGQGVGSKWQGKRNESGIVVGRY